MNERFDGVDGRTTNTQAEANVSAFFVKALFQCRIATRIMVQLSVYLKKRELHEIAYSKTFNFI